MGFQFKSLSVSADGRPIAVPNSETLIHTGRTGASQVLTLRVFNDDSSAREVTIEVAGQSALPFRISTDADSASEEFSLAIVGAVAVTAQTDVASGVRIFGYVVEDNGGGPRS